MYFNIFTVSGLYQFLLFLRTFHYSFIVRTPYQTGMVQHTLLLPLQLYQHLSSKVVQIIYIWFYATFQFDTFTHVDREAFQFRALLRLVALSASRTTSGCHPRQYLVHFANWQTRTYHWACLPVCHTVPKFGSSQTNESAIIIILYVGLTWIFAS